MSKNISKLHFITQDIDYMSHEQQAEEACKVGVGWVQLRMKQGDYDSWKKTALAVQAVCKKYQATFIINDHVNLALSLGADGVHLGKKDMLADDARKLLGNNFIIGGTANTIDDVEALNSIEVNYIGLGPFRYTSTKEQLSPILGLEGIQSIVKSNKNSNIPIIAIGGITPEDIPMLKKIGVWGIAVSSAINLAKDKKLAINQFLKSL